MSEKELIWRVGELLGFQITILICVSVLLFGGLLIVIGRHFDKKFKETHNRLDALERLLRDREKEEE